MEHSRRLCCVSICDSGSNKDRALSSYEPKGTNCPSCGVASMKLAQSLDYESVDDGECEKEGVGGLSLDEPEVTSGGIHESVSHETGTISAGISAS